MVEPDHRVIPHISFIQPEHELIDIPAHVLLVPVMIDPVVTPLQHRPDVLYPVHMGPYIWFTKLFCALSLTASCL